MEKMDGVLRPSRSLELDGKDQRLIFDRGGSRLHGQDLGSCRSLLPLGKLGAPGNVLAGGS